MKKTIHILTVGFALTLASCKNPADQTTDAQVKDAAAAATAEGGTKYHFTPESKIEFTGSKVTGSHSGGFKSFTGEFTLKDNEPVAGEFTIDMNSTYSDHKDLTSHLKNEDFFDVPGHPESKFVATGFTKNSDSSYDLSGNLTLRGNTKNITFPVTVAKGEDSFTLTSEFDINRQDFGVAYAGRKDDLIRDEVIIKLTLKASK